ncbi:YceD family protein [Falsirhodobacter deserti]|uniref:YceD family protein n=1 Tax=Falsirhodobacter deserti TaxID=1365611 RepID=UPI000FE36E41|nr:DUF177 domain-containing protein [Falsirhodobacter deserti]
MHDEPQNHILRVATLPTRKPHRFRLRPTDAELRRMAQDLKITSISGLVFEGDIRAEGREDFRLEGKLKAVVEQPCVVTLAPVKTRIDTRLHRKYIARFTTPMADEAEMPEDDTQEPLPEVIDLLAVASEELALSLPLYPRAEGAELGEAVFAPPGAEPLKDADLRPFAGLQALKDKLKDGN